ncbi:MAG TPA: D-Ala-D-Ala carboxypeptidase family metallohydrolase [Lysobacter sp.]
MRGTRAMAAALLLALTACTPPPPSHADRYAAWLSSGVRGNVDAYARFLRERGVGDVVTMPQLLTTARRWRTCGAPEFAVPPRGQWQAMADTLELVRDLRRAGLLSDARVASAWRGDALNRCEGGAPRSRHVANNALDFDLGPHSGDHARWCAYWRQAGPARRFGLGYYDAHRIHVDTSGFRTWGSDHRRRTSPCAAPARRRSQMQARPHAEVIRGPGAVGGRAIEDATRLWTLE